MFIAALAFLSGNLFIHSKTSLLTVEWLLVLCVISLLAAGFRLFPAWRQIWETLIWLMVGILWSWYFSSQLLQQRLPDNLEGNNLEVIGTVRGVPTHSADSMRFILQVEEGYYQGEGVEIPHNIRLTWYRPGSFNMVSGERWRLLVRLKRPHGTLNPGGFDYQRWLFSEEIRATGYVRKSEINRRVDGPTGWNIDRLRLQLAHRLSDILSHHPEQVGVISALTLGLRDQISDDQWQIFMRSGTNHLIAISGLHIGLVAGLVFMIGRWGWGYCSFSLQRLSAPQGATLIALLAAAGYAALAGFSIPTQRAIIMLAVAAVALIAIKKVSALHLWGCALILVLLFDPFASLKPGFWLSFAAVLILIMGMGYRTLPPGRYSPVLRYLMGMLRVQWLLFFALSPLLLLLFGQMPIASPIANLVAVPIIGLLVVPLALLGLLLTGLPFQGPSAWLLEGAAWLLKGTMAAIELIQNLMPPLLLVPHQAWLMVPIFIGSLWLLMPRGWPGRWIAPIAFVPLFFLSPSRPEQGQIRFTLLDVGQGLAAVIETRSHNLLFDSGNRFPSGFNMGNAVILPFLAHQGIRNLDRVIISHADMDHRGGIEAVIGNLPVADLMVSEALSIKFPQRGCRSGESWQWDGIDFEILHPAEIDGNMSENDRSCVLKINTSNGSLLLPGDIEESAEKQLVARAGEKIKADILVAPHHGSKTSSSELFLHNVQPEWVLLPYGYRNRYRFPHEVVIKRYQDHGINKLSSADSGAIQFCLGTGCDLTPLRWRDQGKRYWHN